MYKFLFLIYAAYTLSNFVYVKYSTSGGLFKAVNLN